MVVGEKKSYAVVGESGGIPPQIFCIFPPLGLHFVCFLKQIFEYTALHYTVDRLNLQLKYLHGMFM